MEFYEETRLLAYQLWEQDGRPVGRHIEHWHQAEEIIRNRKKQQAAMIKPQSPAQTGRPQPAGKTDSKKAPSRETGKRAAADTTKPPSSRSMQTPSKAKRGTKKAE